MPGQIGLIQATEVIKLILDKGRPLIGQFLVYNALDMEFKSFSVTKSPSCPLCNEKSKIRELQDGAESCSIQAAAV